MKAKVLPISSLDDFVKTLSKSYVVIGPAKKDGLKSYHVVSSAEELALEETSCLKGPKEFLFPQNETLVQFEGYIDRAVPMEGMEEAERSVLFAVRPCDARSLVILDKLFINEDYVDDYYKAKRDVTAIICLSCNQPRTTCFCTSVGGEPFDTAGCDVSMTRIGEEFLMEPLTERGESLLQNLDEADPEMLEKKEEMKREALEIMADRLELEGLPEKLKAMFEHPVWQEITDKCMGCGVCTYLCPTCHCFDIQDEAVDDKGKRLRNWDSCMFPLFTYHGSGHQPRDRRYQRMRQRIMHKFNYFVENFGIIACVGCGRCVTECPTNEDLRQNLKKLSETEPAKVD